MISNEEKQPEVDIVTDLVTALNSNRQFYEEAASNLRSAELRDLFRRRAAQRAEFAAELREETAVPVAAEESSLSDFLDRGLMTVRAAMTIERDLTDEVVLVDAQEAEHKLLQHYNAALTTNDAALKPTLRYTLQRQYAQIRTAASYITAATTGPQNVVVLALFNGSLEAQTAVESLTAQGIPRDQIAVLAEESAVREALTENRREMTQASAGAGAVGGGVFGGVFGFLSGVSMSLLLGPVLLVGLPAVAGITAVGAGIGAAYGGLAGGLLGFGIGDEEVQAYINGLRHGQIMVLAHVSGEQKEKAEAALTAAGGQDVGTRYDTAVEDQEGPA
jgi:uncharacterized protein (TIGR02284 family)